MSGFCKLIVIVPVPSWFLAALPSRPNLNNASLDRESFLFLRSYKI